MKDYNGNQEGGGTGFFSIWNNIFSVKSFHNYVEDTKIYNEEKDILQKDILYRKLFRDFH